MAIPAGPQATARRGGTTIAMVVCMLISLPTRGAASASYFAAPGSGQRVSEYQVELAVARHRRQAYRIPTDCTAVLHAVAGGESFRGTIVDRRLWRKVENDCRFQHSLHRHPQQGLTDHVGAFDFTNARLDDLGIGQHCTGDSNGGRECEWLRENSQKETQTPAGDGPQPICRLRGGVFYGRLFANDTGVRCQPDPQRPTLRLVSVDFADIDGDHVRDAVLRLVPIGPGAVRLPIILLLTRHGPDEALRRLPVNRSSGARQASPDGASATAPSGHRSDAPASE